MQKDLVEFPIGALRENAAPQQDRGPLVLASVSQSSAWRLAPTQLSLSCFASTLRVPSQSQKAVSQLLRQSRKMAVFLLSCASSIIIIVFPLCEET